MTEGRLPSSCKFVKFLHKALLVFFLQLLLPGLSAKLVVEEKDIADLQLAALLKAEVELVEDRTLT